MQITSKKFDDLIITDQTLISQYLQEDFYIPPTEKSSIESELIESKNYTTSAKELNKQLEPIYIAINSSDPYAESNNSEFRIHLRIISGRHRYLQSKEDEIKWDVVFLQIEDFEQFMEIYSHFGSKKLRPFEDYKQKIIEYCNYLFNEKGVTPKHNICNMAVQKFGGGKIASDQTIRTWVPLEFKVSYRIANAIKQTMKSKSKKESKKDIKIRSLENELDATRRELFTAKETIADLEKKLKKLQ